MQRIFSFLSISAFNSYELTAEIAQSTTLKKQCFQSKNRWPLLKQAAVSQHCGV
ncbi:hypothetical protein ABU16_1351 [Bacillus subtilis]|uniref:hypothetical protein n=1 Tax=Bacillus subtilis TaxID=1423 RepID=UPI0005017D01|nr:hypothetical protein [Bacillus subtilis]AKN12427.1 hypothetical protein ABU16_1351 [Bacillus subtilis]NDK02346.1 hypothetical protein [Bacillus subtilis subsp. subtilis]GAK82380.1 hypothetical protein BSMD_043460 [Bacillus subtilis Miyagi-4]